MVGDQGRTEGTVSGIGGSQKHRGLRMKVINSSIEFVVDRNCGLPDRTKITQAQSDGSLGLRLT